MLRYQSFILLVFVLIATALIAVTAAVVADTSFHPWWEQGVCYEVLVRSFADSNGDGIGDLQGLINKLDYLNDGNPATTTDLGVTCLWLMPIFSSPSYHGYDVTDYYQINPDYGDLTTFKRLLQAAHARGIHVIIDLVLNHTSDRHPWFIDSATGPNSDKRNWYIWSNADPGYAGPWGEKVWHWRNGAYYYGIFWSGMPDLNYRNPAVTAQMENVARFWLNMGVDGFRLDAVKHLIEDGPVQENTPETHAWLQGFHRFYKTIAPDSLTVGEIWDTPQVISTYYDGQLDMCFAFNIAHATIASVNAGDPSALESVRAEIACLYPSGRYATFLTNHDQPRTMTQLDGNADKAKLAATILLTSAGVPFIYYGEEIGMTGAKPDECIRTPMQWTAAPHAGFTSGRPWESVNPGYQLRNVRTEHADPDSVLNHYRRLIHLRDDYPALHGGVQKPVRSTAPAVYAYLRHVGLEDILVVANFSGSAVSDYRLSTTGSPIPPGSYFTRMLLGTGTPASIIVDGHGGFSDYQPLPTLAPRTGYVILVRSQGER